MKHREQYKIIVHSGIIGSKQCYKLYFNAVICLKNRLLLYLGINKVKKNYTNTKKLLFYEYIYPVVSTQQAVTSLTSLAGCFVLIAKI